MKYFMEFVKFIRNPDNLEVENINDNYNKRLTSDDIAIIKDRDLLYKKIINECQPIVFHPNYFSKKESSGSIKTLGDLSPPFRCFSIETFGDDISLEEMESNASLRCTILYEIRPRLFFILCFIEINDKSSMRYELISSVSDDSTGFEPSSNQYRCMELLNSGEIGLEPVMNKVRVSSDKEKNKSYRTINRIIHIRKKQKKNNIKPNESSRITWSHRFSVRGHWRDVRGIGKDRDGNYCVDGSTWIRDFIKGDDSLPIITKTRYVHGYKKDGTSEATL